MEESFFSLGLPFLQPHLFSLCFQDCFLAIVQFVFGCGPMTFILYYITHLYIYKTIKHLSYLLNY